MFQRKTFASSPLETKLLPSGLNAMALGSLEYDRETTELEESRRESTPINSLSVFRCQFEVRRPGPGYARFPYLFRLDTFGNPA